MTIRNLFATTVICCSIILAGCATNGSVKNDSAAPSTTKTVQPLLLAQSVETGDSLTADAINNEAIPAVGGSPGQNDGAGLDTRLATAYFDLDSFLLSADSRDTLSHNARWLTENPQTHVVIEGHTDERGADEYNQALGEKRALAARRYIETLGVSHDRMNTISYGEEKPAVTGHDETSWTKNRRVEFVIIK